MEFYDGLLNELSKFNEFVDRAKDDDLSLATVYGMEKSKFILYAMSQQDNKKLTLKLLDGCIRKEIWGFLSFMLVDCSSYTGVDTFIIKNIQRIPKELQASIIAILCYGQKWMNSTLNELFLELLKKQGCPSDRIQGIEEDEIEVYYPLGWNESIEAAVKNPCWHLAMDSAARYCMFSKFYYSRKNENIKDYTMFGDGEIHGINTVKMRMLKGKIRKSDIIGYIDPSILYGDFLPLENIFQNQSVYDVEIIEQGLAESEEVNELGCYLLATNDDLECDDGIVSYADDLFEKLLESCEKGGIPAYTPVSEISNKIMEKPADLAKLLRVRSRVRQGDALKTAKAICKAEKNAKWVYANSKGYKKRKGYYYRGLGYSAYTHQVIPMVLCYKSDDSIGIYGNEEFQKKHARYTDIFAFDFDTESKTLEGCLEKCKKIAEGDTEKQIKAAAEPARPVSSAPKELSSEEKDKLKQDYLADVDEEITNEINKYKKIADFAEAENVKLKDQNNELSRQIDFLKKQLDAKQRIIDAQKEIPVLHRGKEKPKYEGEIKAFVKDALETSIEHISKDTRRYDVISDLIDSNFTEKDVTLEDKLEHVASATKGYRTSSDLKKDLEEAGLVITGGGKHPKIQFKGDERYMLTCASTTSDVRAGDNLYAQIKKKFF